MQCRNLYLVQISSMEDQSVEIVSSWYFLPYTIGLLWSYAKTNPIIAKNYTLKKMFWRPDDEKNIINQIKNPDVIGFSNYLWNTEFHLKIAYYIKKKYPNCLIVFGGPNIPLDPHWLKDRPFIDLIVHQEGEITFSEILLQRIISNDFSRINGISINGNQFLRTPEAKRIEDINDIPSPYLNGLFDEIVAENPHLKFHAVFETNRGCPFKCTFCDWGGYTHQKMKKFDLDKCKTEINWMVNNKIHTLWFADSNTGIFKGRDLEIFNHIKKMRLKHNYPKIIAVTGYSKTPPDKNDTLEIQKIVSDDDSLGIRPRIAVQSFNKEALKNIKRDNLNIYNIADLNKSQTDNSITAEVELIFPLPGTTYESFINDFDYLISHGNIIPQIYCCLLLPRSEMASPAYRKMHGVKTTKMLFNSKGETCEIVTSLNSITEEEVTQSWMLTWVIWTFWYSNLCKKLIQKISLMHDEREIDILVKLQKFIENDDSPISIEYEKSKKNLHKSFLNYNLRDICSTTVSSHLFETNTSKGHLNAEILKKFISAFLNEYFEYTEFISNMIFEDTMFKTTTKKYNPVLTIGNNFSENEYATF